MTSFTK